jgi:hypothetical protein
MTKRLAILKNSLAKKQKQFNDKIQDHFDTVKQSNGQPLNDKRNGQATLNKRDRQNESLRNLKESIAKTERAIEREEGKIMDVEAAKEVTPKEILELVNKGVLTQWRKHPNTFFVDGVEKARIVWNEKKKQVAHRYVISVPSQEQYSKFAKVFNSLNQALNN